MKILTVTVPCYNSEAYMERCIESLLPGGDDVEILIVDDGSTKDRTAEIADQYEKKYPNIVRAIHQENKGHGGAVNTGIRNASGLYFKVVDSDDWVDEDAYRKILSALNGIVRGSTMVDVVLSNYVYEKQGVKRKRVMKYGAFFPQDRPFTWREMKPLPLSRYVLMHSIIYRTGLLRETGLTLPEHTFYVDNIYAYEPFAAVKTLYYVDANFYRYFIGRDDQSVNEKVMLTRMDQQIRVNNRMIDFMHATGCRTKGAQWRFLMHSLSIIMTITSILLIRSKESDALEKKKALWDRLKAADRGAYLWIRFGMLGVWMNLPGESGRKLSEKGYELAQKFYGFN
ncbi:MAG: glycosyltransferase [Lachnospiraceae bacterium]|jgi:glycosyltransferase involved in cell wall biosynthesis|nr:glycosyltransferase [Lachnospiraceae bacterium]MCI1327449.1 glycosyltransferase [Lachnospiraceae bacterium]